MKQKLWRKLLRNYNKTPQKIVTLINDIKERTRQRHLEECTIRVVQNHRVVDHHHTGHVVVRWSGLDDRSPRVRVPVHRETLANRNRLS